MPEENAGSTVPAVFGLPLRVVEADIDGMGHVNNIVYLRWVQEVATAHWNAAATEQQIADYAWVVLRHEIDYLRPALLGEETVSLHRTISRSTNVPSQRPRFLLAEDGQPARHQGQHS